MRYEGEAAGRVREVAGLHMRPSGSTSTRAKLLMSIRVDTPQIMDSAWSEMRAEPEYHRLPREQAQAVRDQMAATAAMFADCLHRDRPLSSTDIKQLTTLGAIRAEQNIPLETVQHVMQALLDRFTTRLWAAADALGGSRASAEARAVSASLDALALAARGAISEGWVQRRRADRLFDSEPASRVGSGGRAWPSLAIEAVGNEVDATAVAAIVVVALPGTEEGAHRLMAVLQDLRSRWAPDRTATIPPAILSHPGVHGIVVLTPACRLTGPMHAVMEALARQHAMLFILGRKLPGQDVEATYRRIASCLGVARQLGKGRPVVSLDDFAVYEPLMGTPQDQARLIIGDTLGSLLDEPEGYVDELLRTLRVLLKVRWVATEAARELTVHPNTVRNRVKALAHLTGRSVTEPADLERFATAIRLMDMYPTLLARNGG